MSMQILLAQKLQTVDIYRNFLKKHLDVKNIVFFFQKEVTEWHAHETLGNLFYIVIIKMHSRILSILVFFLGSVASQSDEIKKGIFPYMAFIYYSDDSVVDRNGERVTRTGILIKPDWLITSSLETDEMPLAFPEKTLVARLGSVSVDATFALNEDEDEQENEIIQICRPYNFSLVEWWLSDISLLKTLLPFNKSTGVGITPLAPKYVYSEQECFILVYARKLSNKTMDRFLMQIPVVVVPSDPDNCGSHYRQKTMICSQDVEDKMNMTYDPKFCTGNGGGPLVCADNIYGLQTYINGTCEAPHLYQLFSGWETFISCGIQDSCEQKQCDQVCTVIGKDADKWSPKETMALLSDGGAKVAAEVLSVIEDAVKKASPSGATATAVRDFEEASTLMLSSSVLLESSLETLAAEVDSGAENDTLRRANMEAQKEPPKKKNCASTLLPRPAQLPILFWVVISFA